jgi:predicted amidohydrolase YtcJ
MEPFQAQSLADLKKMMTQYAAQHPDRPFVIGLGWTYHYIPGGMPTKEMADDILADRPLVLWSSGGQTGWVNTKMLNRMMNANPAAYRSLMPVIGSDNQPTGVFLNFVAFNFLDYFSPDEVTDEIHAGMAMGVRQILAEGVSRGTTTYNDIQLKKPFLPHLLQYANDGFFDRVRLRGSYYVSQESLKDEAGLKKDLAAWIGYGKYNSPHLKLGDSVKLYIDGVGGSHTAFLLEPYADRPGEYGTPFWTQADFNRVCWIVDDMGLQICTHANGGAGQRRIINGYEHVSQTNSAWDARHRIEHCELPHPDDWSRMGDLNIHAAMQPSHIFGVNQEYIDLYGPERVRRFMPWKGLLDQGVPLSFGSDWSAAPVNPLIGLFMAKHRLCLIGRPWGQNDYSIDMDQAVRAYTIGSARDLKMESEVGSLEVGKFADFVILEEDVFDEKWPKWLDLSTFNPYVDFNDKVFMTVFNGQVVFQK